MRVNDIMNFFEDFYEDFDRNRAMEMLDSLHIQASDQIRHMSKGTKEKVQLILVMSCRARLYCLDEPIAGVDPAARDYILSTILSNYDPEATILISTHLIADIENILDEVVFIQNGQIRIHDSVDNIRYQQNKSVDALFLGRYSDVKKINQTRMAGHLEESGYVKRRHPPSGDPGTHYPSPSVQQQSS